MGMTGGKKFKAAIPGGVAMGFLGADEFGAELDFDIGRREEMGFKLGGQGNFRHQHKHRS